MLSHKNRIATKRGLLAVIRNNSRSKPLFYYFGTVLFNYINTLFTNGFLVLLS